MRRASEFRSIAHCSKSIIISSVFFVWFDFNTYRTKLSYLAFTDGSDDGTFE